MRKEGEKRREEREREKGWRKTKELKFVGERG